MNTIEEDLLAREESLFSDGVRTDPARIAGLLDEKFVEFTSSGKVFQYTRGAAFGASPERISIESGSARFIDLDEGVKLLQYVAVKEGADGTTGLSLRSSIWRLGDGVWKLVFHQGTPFTR
jgi:hypothetical protein